MPKCYRILGIYENGSTESFGRFDTREKAEDYLISLEQSLKDIQKITGNFYTIPEEFEIREFFIFKI